MKRTIYPVLMTAALLLTGLVMTGCKNDNNAPEQPAKAQTYRMRITASKGTDTPTNGPRRVLSLDGTTLNAVWATGEQVSVYNVTKGAALGGRLEAQSGGASTQLEGDLTGTVEAGDILTLRFLSPAYADQQGTLAYISANCDYAEAENVEVASVSGRQIQAANDAVFANQQAIIRFTLKDAADGTTPLNPTAFAVNDGTSDIATLTSIPASTYAANGDGVLYAAVPGFSGKTITLTATVGADTYIYTKPNVTIDNGSYYTLSAEMSSFAPAYDADGALNGLFSVSSTKQVKFSRGNLQYQASTGIWRFAEHQYDFVGDVTNGNVYVGDTKCSNTMISSTYSGWIDLFGWGTSGWNSGATAYQPYSTSTDYEHYRPNNSNNADLTGSYARADWGVYNAISNGGNRTNLWRTLTIGEWYHLFLYRTDAFNKRAQGSIDGVNGYILLPDEWTLPDGLTFTISPFNYTTNSYTLTQWAKMESAGAVFLPAAGYRYGNGVSLVGKIGGYWSTTHHNNMWARYSEFNSDVTVEDMDDYDACYYNVYRDYGYNVRLVK